jgi:murein DD-endopeptidase MepM/ murein hydrolase activator NlpD
VGATGMATGPHLDFRLQKDGKFINFLSLKMVPTDPLPDEYMAQFKVLKDEFLSMTNQLKQKEIIVFKNHKGKSV